MTTLHRPVAGAATLYVWRIDARTLADALRAAPAVHGGVALLSEPRRHVVAVAGDGACADADGRPIALDAAFEARCFTPDAELRWLRDPRSLEPLGTMVLLSEDARAGALLDTAHVEPLHAIETIGPRAGDDRQHGYLLWGELADRADGSGTWRFRDGRVGELIVPSALLSPERGTRRRARLLVREYVASDDEHGNSYVAEERLLRLAWAD